MRDIIDSLNNVPDYVQRLVNHYGGMAVLFDGRLTDLPTFETYKGKIPETYQRVGWVDTYDTISGIFRDNKAYSKINGDDVADTSLHEYGHLVDYLLGGIISNESPKFSLEKEFLDVHSDASKDDFTMLYLSGSGIKKDGKMISYCDDPEEFFACAFSEYYQSKETRETLNWNHLLTKQYFDNLEKRILKFARNNPHIK